MRIMSFIAVLAAALVLSACESMPKLPSFGTADPPTSAASQTPQESPTPAFLAREANERQQVVSPPARSAGHTAGLPMMYALSKAREGNAKELARYIKESLRRDPSGNDIIEGSPCTTPRMFAEAIRQYHPGSGLSGFAALPEYVRSLQLRKAPEGEYPMSRVLVRKSGTEGPTECGLDLQGWTRAFSPGEGAWYDPNTGEPVLAGDCSNVVGSPTKKAETPPPTISGSCPDVYTLKVNIWPNEAADLDSGVRVAINAAAYDGSVGTFEEANRVSKMGGIFRRAAAKGELQHSRNGHVVKVSLIKEDEHDRIVKERRFGMVRVVGLRELRLTREQIESWDAIRLVFVGEHRLLSPVRYNGTGEKEIRFYNRLPGKPLGEWENNPVPDCIMNVHVIETRR